MPVSGLSHFRAKSLYVNESIFSRDVITRISSHMPQLTTVERITLPNIQNGVMAYDIEIDDLFVFKQNQWTSLTVSTIDPSQDVHLTNLTPSTNPQTGTLVVNGGVGIGLDLNVAGSVDITEILTIGDDSESIDELTGAMVISGGVGIGKSLNIGGNITTLGTMTLGEGTSSYSLPIEKGQGGQVLAMSTDGSVLEFSEFSITNNINSEFPFTQDDLMVKTKDTGITETGISISNDNDISGINTLTLGTGTSSYSLPNQKGSTGQILVVSTTGSLVFQTTSVSNDNVNATTDFGNDNVLIKSDGTNKNVQSTGISIDDSNNVSGINVLTLGTGTSTYTFPNETGSSGQILVMSTTGSLVFETANVSPNLVTSPNTFTSDNSLLKSDGTGRDIQSTGISIDDNNNVSGINELTLGTGTSSYTFPGVSGVAGQLLVLSTTGSLVFETANVSPNLVNAPSVFGSDNILLKSDGTGRDVQSTGISISDFNDMSGLNSVSISGTTSSLSSTTGSLIVVGGVGIGENLNVASNITFEGRLTGRVRDVTEDTTLDDDYIVNVAPTGTGGATITLPNIQNHVYTGVTYMIIKENSNPVIIETDNVNDKITSAGSEVTTLSLTGLSDERITLVSNGKKWVTM